MKRKNNNPEFDDYERSKKAVAKTIKKYTRYYKRNINPLSERLQETLDALQKDFEENYRQSFFEASSQLEKIIKKLPQDDIIQLFQNSIKEIDFDLLSSEYNETAIGEIEVDLDDLQLSNIENLNIDINEYCDETKSSKNKKFFTSDKAVELIGLLLALISFIFQILPNKEEEKQTELLQEEVSLLKEMYANSQETVDLLKAKLEQTTPDEATH